jgi:ABC-2 type transport system ATP-binding protein
MAPAIELLDVTKSFRAKTAVSRLNLNVPAGSIYGFVGPNGSGKTTTLRMILRIYQPDSGEVRVLGNSQGTAADSRLGYLPEERGLYKRMKVREVLRYYARLKGSYHCDPEIDAWLERFGAQSWAKQKVESLSKGMAQKIQFISSVVAKPKLLILDEPFSGLDPVNLEVLKDAVLELRKRGTTIIFSTHDMSMAERMCDSVVMIHDGRKVLDGTLAEIQSLYPVNEIRCRIEYFPADGSNNQFGEPPIPKLPHVTSIRFDGRDHFLQLEESKYVQPVMQALAHARVVSHFELIKPTLHDIFVRIAGVEHRPPTP